MMLSFKDKIHYVFRLDGPNQIKLSFEEFVDLKIKDICLGPYIIMFRVKDEGIIYVGNDEAFMRAEKVGYKPRWLMDLVNCFTIILDGDFHPMINKTFKDIILLSSVDKDLPACKEAKKGLYDDVWKF